MIANVGDKVMYIGPVYKGLSEYEKEFLNKILEIGKYYKIISIENDCYSTGIPWYRIILNDKKTYHVPHVCFVLNIKERYDLR